ncbi:Uncharacterised protein [Achromobacter dolens]|nr:Uncharacterised protein [Achromobacter dolens]
MRRNDGLWGELCAWRFGAHRSWREGLAGPAASRPRGRPFAAYVVSCVGMMTLSRVERPPIRCYCTAIGTTKRALSGAIARLPAPRLLSAAHALVTRKPALNAPPLPPPPSERNHQKTARHPRAAHPLHFQMHRRLSWPPARPRWAAPQIPFPAPGSSSATSPDARSPSGGRPRWRATSMRPTESEGVAEGEDEDEAGEVRSERSGPQSWAPAIGAARPRGDLRRPTHHR